MPKRNVAIGTWPTPERTISIEIPVKLLQEFKADARVILRDFGTVGIVAPEAILEPEIRDKIDSNGYEVMIVPKSQVWG